MTKDEHKTLMDRVSELRSCRNNIIAMAEEFNLSREQMIDLVNGAFQEMGDKG